MMILQNLLFHCKKFIRKNYFSLGLIYSIIFQLINSLVPLFSPKIISQAKITLYLIKEMKGHGLKKINL